MIIECDSCSTKFRLDESKITEHGVKVRCTKCENVFIVHAPVEDASIVEPTPVEQPGGNGETGEKLDQDEAAGDLPGGKSDEEPAEDDGKSGETKEERASIGGLSFSLGSDEDEEHEQGDGQGEEETENDFLLDGFNRMHQGGDDIDLDDPAFNLLDDDEDEDDNAPDLPDEETDDFTFNIDTDDLAEDDPQDDPGASFEPSDTTGELHGTPSGNDEEDAACAPVGEESDAGAHSAFEAALRRAEEEKADTDETVEAEGAEPATEPATEKDTTANIKNYFESSLKKSAQEEPLTEPATGAGAVEPGAQGLSADNAGGYGTNTATDEGADTTVAPYDIDKRGSRSPLLLGMLLIVAIGALLYFTGIAGKVLNGNGTNVGSLTVGITKTGSYIVQNREIGPVFVVEAELLNMTDTPQKISGVQGTLYNRSGNRLSVRKVSPGRVVSSAQLRNMSRQVLLRNFKDASGGTIPPKGTVPVMLLFTNAPEATVEYSLDVIR